MACEVTVIAPYRNAANFLPEFVSMLRAQVFPYWTCFLIDDGSSDAGYDIAAKLVSSDPRFLLLKRTLPKPLHAGPAAARNEALSYVKTPFVAFCDIDDLWHPDKLEKQFFLQKSQNLDLVVTGYGRFRLLKKSEVFAWCCPPSELTYQKLLGSNPIPMLTVLVRHRLLSGGMPIVPHEDFALWLQLFHQHPNLRYGCVPEGLAFYRVHASNLTAQRWRMAAWAWQVFWRHGLRGPALALAMGRWCADQVLNLIRQRLPKAPLAPGSLSVSALLEQPPVRLQRRNS